VEKINNASRFRVPESNREGIGCKHYQQIVSALAETIRLMAEIDETIDNHDGWPLGDK
jgi:hypothetical protein